tara:strand:- start:81394 stop:83007 length:1614 start_codon:yes stop_codon:yes gene_type:complete
VSFDPLHKWLGIAPDEQPPNHYRLLGISKFESDKEVIDSAANKQLQFLHDLTNGENGADAERLSNQISAVRLLLLDDERRLAYDQRLSEQSQREAEFASVQPTEPSITAAAPATQSSVTTYAANWYLRHHDQIEHGPFSIEALIEAAKDGRIAPDTRVWHPVSTGGDWVLANSIAGIAQYCPAGPTQTAPRRTIDNPEQPLVQNVSVRPRQISARRGDGFASVFIQSAIPVALLAITLAVIYQNPVLKRRLQDSLFGKSQQTNEAVRRSNQSQSARQASAMQEASPKRRHSETSTFKQDGQFVSEVIDLSSRSGMHPMVSPQPAIVHDALSADVADSRRQRKLKLSLASTRWIAQVDEPDTHSQKAERLIVRTVTNTPTPVRLSPSTGDLSNNRRVRVEFENMLGLALLLRTDPAEPNKLIGDWVYRAGNDPDSMFTMGRMKSREIYLRKQLTDANRVLAQAQSTRNRHQNFLDSPQLKRLSAVKVSELAIKKIDDALPTYQERVASCQQNIQTFSTFAENITNLNENAELVIEFVH